MAPWFAVVVPAFVVALAVRLDAKLVGPYFSMASLVAGMVGFDDRYFNSAKTLKYALTRRFFYPFLLGITLALCGLSLGETTASGLLAAVLLLWPAVFQPLPQFVSLRDWQVLAVWMTFALAFGALAALGWYVVEIVYAASAGDVLDYVFGLVRDGMLTLIFTWFLLAFFRGSFESMRIKVESRNATGQNDVDPSNNVDE